MLEEKALRNYSIHTDLFSYVYPVIVANAMQNEC